MATHPTTTESNRIHKIQLNNLQGAAIVRCNAEGKIAVAVAAAARFRYSDKADVVRVITPATLMKSMYEATTSVTPQVVMISGRARPLRAAVELRDYPEYTSIIEALTPGGKWAQLTFGRIGVTQNFETNRRFLDDETWALKNGTQAVGLGREFNLADGDASAIHVAGQVPTAWHMMTALGKLIGGIDPRSIPEVVNVPMPETVREMIEAEYSLRRARRARAYQPQQQAGPTPILNQIPLGQ